MKLIPSAAVRLLKKIQPLMRLSPFDQTTEEGRAQERHRKVLLSAMASAAAKIISVSTALISVPLTLNYLGVERYGLWMAISSVIAMLSFADLGMGNGVLSEVAKAQGENDTIKIVNIISSGFAALAGIGFVVLAIFFSCYSFISWGDVFNVKTNEAAEEIGPAVAVFIVIFAINMPLGIVGRVQGGLQQSFRASLWQCAGSLIGLVAMLAVIEQEKNLPWLVAALAGAPLVATLVNGCHFFSRIAPDLRPARGMISVEVIKNISRTGVMFFALQLSGALAFSADNFLIARIMGAAEIANYAVPEKLFSLITVALSMLLSPLWPAYGEAISRGDNSWVKKTVIKSIKTSMLISAILSISMLILSPYIMQYWVGAQVSPPFILLLGLFVWKVFEAGGSAVAAYMNGARIVGAQVIFSLVTSVIAILLKIWVLGEIGISGMPWVMCGSFIIFSFAPSIYLIGKNLRRT